MSGSSGCAELTVDRLRQVLHYDPVTGVLTWRVRKASNAAAGSVAGTFNQQGYRLVRVDGRSYRAHRLAWLYVHGRWPSSLIDHVNGDRADNRLGNLRDADPQLNSENQRTGRQNRLGVLGVYAYRRGFISHIQVKGKTVHLGYFDTTQEAHAAYVAAKRRLHPGCTL